MDPAEREAQARNESPAITALFCALHPIGVVVRFTLRKPPYWMPTLNGPLRRLWPLYVRYAWWREVRT